MKEGESIATAAVEAGSRTKAISRAVFRSALARLPAFGATVIADRYAR
jgi:hypothetical protein